MSDSLDRRTLLKGAAVVRRRARLNWRGPAAFPDGLSYGEPVAFSYELFKAQAREKCARPLRRPAAAGAGCRAEDQLRGMGQNPLSQRSCAVRRRPRPVPDDVLPPRPVLPEGGGLPCDRWRTSASRSSTISPISTCPPNSVARAIAAGRGLCGVPHPGVARRPARLAQERLGRLSRRGLFSRHRRIAPIRPVRRAASRSTSRSPTGRKNFPISPSSTSNSEEGATRSCSTR